MVDSETSRLEEAVDGRFLCVHRHMIGLLKLRAPERIESLGVAMGGEVVISNRKAHDVLAAVFHLPPPVRVEVLQEMERAGLVRRNHRREIVLL